MHKRKSANTQLRHTHIHTYTHTKKKKEAFAFPFFCWNLWALVANCCTFPRSEYVELSSLYRSTNIHYFPVFCYYCCSPFVCVYVLCFFLLFSLYKVQGSFFFFFGSYKPESCTVLYYCYLLLPVFCCLFWSSAIFSFIFTNVYFFFFSNVLPFFLVLFLSCHPVFPYSWRDGNCKWQLREMNVVECGRYFFLI